MKKEQKALESNIWQTLGQLGAKHLLGNFLNTKNAGITPHAFLFLGPEGVGKTALALEFARKFSAAQSQKSEILEFDFAETGSVENLRELISFSSLTSSNGGKKIFVVKNFQLASVSGSNILLKTLEEPASSSMFLLIANSNRVLPTIMSRCVAIRCFPVDGLALSSTLPNNLLAVVEQYPGLAARLEKNPNQAKTLSDLLDKLQNRKMSLINLNELVELEAEDLNLLVSLWMNSLRLSLFSQPKDLLGTIHNLKVAQNFNDDLKRSYNTKLVLQQFLIQTK